MGLPMGGFCWSFLRSSSSGHQSRFDRPSVECTTGHLLSSSMLSSLWLQCGCQAPGCLRCGLTGARNCHACASPLAATSACKSVDAGSRSGLGLAFRTETPVDDLGFVDLVAHVVDRREAGREAGCAVDVGHAAAAAADHVVVIVADPGLEACR